MTGKNYADKYKDDILKILKDNALHFEEVIFKNKGAKKAIIILVNKDVKTIDYKEYSEKLTEGLGERVLINKNKLFRNDSNPERNSSDIPLFFMDRWEYQILIYCSKLLDEVEFLNYNRKQFIKKYFSDKSKNHNIKRQIYFHQKKVEVILANLIVWLMDKNEKIEIDFEQADIYPNFYIIERNLNHLLTGTFSDLSLIGSSKFDIFSSEDDRETFENIIRLTPKSILGVTKNNISINSDYGLNDIIFRDFNFTFKNEAISENNQFYNLEIEDILTNRRKANIFQRDFNILMKDREIHNYMDSNLHILIKEKYNIENFAITNLSETRKTKKSALIQLINIMRYIDSEYKILLRDPIFKIEDFLINLAQIWISNSISKIDFDSILEQLIHENKKDYDTMDENSIPYNRYVDLIVKTLQTGNSKSILNSINKNSMDLKNEWMELKYFVESENEFIEKYNIKQSRHNSFEKAALYAESSNFRFDLNHILRKLTFSSLVALINSFDLKKYNSSDSAINEIIASISSRKDELSSIAELRNAISHQDNLFNSLKQLDRLEESVKTFLNLMKDNHKLQNYRFQIGIEEVNFDGEMSSKIYGLLKNIKSRSDKQYFVTKKLLYILRDFYKELFGRDVFTKEFFNSVENGSNNSLYNNPSKGLDYWNDILTNLSDFSDIY